jgi:uncharacterized repeat protein (TIGR01451 family)
MLLGKVSYIISAALMIAAMVTNLLPPPVAQAAQGAIWSTTNACGTIDQDVNQFSTGDHVYINGSNFDPGSYDWTITGKPGGASGDPNTIVAPNPRAQFTVDSSGAFCFDAYTVALDDWGEYQIKFDNKGDNYSVNQVTPPNPSLSLTKTDNLNPAKYDHVGQVVAYTLTATNNGNVTLHNVTVSDNPALAGFICTPSSPAASLAPGASVVCTGTHTITQADLDAGSFTDTASASSTESNAPNVNDTIHGNGYSDFALTKTDDLNPAKYDHVGQVVTYTLTATNTGTVTLNNITVGDNPALDGFSCNPVIPLAHLAPGASVVCTGTHTITQADLDAGSFVDTGYAACSEECYPTDEDTIYGTQNTKLGLTKTDNLNPTVYDHVGQVVIYTLTATNISNITLHNVTVTDNPALAGFICTPSSPAASLAPGASVVCTGTHTITQADLDASSFADIASATSNEAPAPDAPDTILGTQSAKLSLTKTDDLNPAKYDHVGQVVTYTLTASNSGNVTLHNVGVTDNPALSGFGCTPTTPATLVVGASIECKGSHTITQADLDAGSFPDTASASSTEVSATDAKDIVYGTQDAVLSLTKSDDLNPSKYNQVGNVVTYTLKATNSGNVTLHDVSVSDSPALAGFECSPSIPAASLAPGSSIVCTGKHSITQADLDAGKFLDTASATSTEDNAPDAPDTVLGIQKAFLSLIKAVTEANFDAAGVTLHYTLVATNSGNVTLTGVSITDSKLGALNCTPLQPATLDPGAKLSCTGTYLTTQADVDAGKVDNIANAGGLFGATPVLADPANASVPALGAAHLSLTKVVTETNFSGEGVELHYTLVATNDGAKTLTDVTITDIKLGTLDCNPAQPTTLAPAEKLTCTGSYLTTQDDVDAGKVDNIANASGTFDGDPVAALPASATVPGLMNPHLSLTKVAAEPNFDAAGVTLHYTLVATNVGNVTLTVVSITDPKLGTLTCVPAQPATLAPEATITCTGTYVTTQNDLNAGRVNNTANAGGMFGLVPVNAAPASAVVPAYTNPPVPGCTDPTALNYNPNATENDGSCIYGGGGGGAILIPVTGVDTGLLGRTLPGSLLGLSFGFAGLGLVLTGLARREED